WRTRLDWSVFPLSSGLQLLRQPLAVSRFALGRAIAKPQAASAFLIAWCGVLFFYGLSAGPLYRTESLRAIIGAECLRGHWLYPVLYGEPFLTKPPGHYAAIALCSLPFGQVTAWSARLPSAIAPTVTMFLMWRLRAPARMPV